MFSSIYTFWHLWHGQSILVWSFGTLVLVWKAPILNATGDVALDPRQPGAEDQHLQGLTGQKPWQHKFHRLFWRRICPSSTKCVEVSVLLDMYFVFTINENNTCILFQFISYILVTLKNVRFHQIQLQQNGVTLSLKGLPGSSFPIAACFVTWNECCQAKGLESVLAMSAKTIVWTHRSFEFQVLYVKTYRNIGDVTVAPPVNDVWSKTWRLSWATKVKGMLRRVSTSFARPQIPGSFVGQHGTPFCLGILTHNFDNQLVEHVHSECSDINVPQFKFKGWYLQLCILDHFGDSWLFCSTDHS